MGRVMTIKAAVQEVVDELRKISDIRRVPDAPPENNSQFPFVIVYPMRGTYFGGPPGLVTGLHGIVIELHIARKDLPRDFDDVMDLFDELPNELFKSLKDAEFSAIMTFGNIEYEFGPLMYADVETIGVTYTMTEVKVMTTL